MAKQDESAHKKEVEKRKLQKKKEKEQRREERKANAKEGRSLEDMIAYVDENGNLTSTPPDPSKKKVIDEKDVVIGARNSSSSADQAANDSAGRKGVVTFFNTSKGFGFIKDSSTQESIFVHIHNVTGSIKENDRVAFETERGPKGLSAVRVKIIS
ncbi:MAG TPA: cold shock domain-containing protein [Ohtaekwangia sp.]|uniref:cold-shock protein n=1 Tax=Ohtaekwangia sp. TaxID=2066019 RepID=UPI002F95E278